MWCEELTHWKRPWCWERWKIRGEGDDRVWDGGMALPTRWTWVWAGSWSWWWTGKPCMLQSMGSQRAGHDWVTELSWTEAHLSSTPGWSKQPVGLGCFENDLVTVYQLLDFWIESEKRLWSRMSNLKACGGQALHVDVWGGCRLGWGHLPFSSFWPVNNLLTDFLILERCQDVGFVHGICFPNAGKSFKLKNKNCVIRMNHHCGLHQVLSLPPALTSLVLPPREGWGDLNFHSHYLVVS